MGKMPRNVVGNKGRLFSGEEPRIFREEPLARDFICIYIILRNFIKR
jgi:hypothetical protein